MQRISYTHAIESIFAYSVLCVSVGDVIHPKREVLRLKLTLHHPLTGETAHGNCRIIEFFFLRGQILRTLLWGASKSIEIGKGKSPTVIVNLECICDILSGHLEIH